jgi:K+-transporting ATPase KdpF subunit
MIYLAAAVAAFLFVYLFMALIRPQSDDTLAQAQALRHGNRDASQTSIPRVTSSERRFGNVGVTYWKSVKVKERSSSVTWPLLRTLYRA